MENSKRKRSDTSLHAGVREGLYRHACTQLNRHTGQVSSQVQLPDTADLRLQVKILRDLRVTLKLRPAST